MPIKPVNADTSCAKCGAAWLLGYGHSMGDCRDNLSGQLSGLRDTLHHLTGPEHRNGQTYWRVTLNKYQRDGLLQALQRIMEEPSFNGLNGGDWVGEIRWMLTPEVRDA